MALVSANIALIIFVIILILAAIIAWRMETYAYYDAGKFHTFVAILAGLGVIVTFMFYYNVVLLQNQQQQLAAVQELARINDSVLNSVLDSIKDASTIIPNFVLSITPLTNTVCCSTGGTGSSCVVTVGADPVNPQTCTEKMTLSYRIFSLWQDVLDSNSYTHLDPAPYVTNFLQRANSPQLYSQWSVSRIDYGSRTQQFGDLLFEYALPITVQTPATYSEVAAKLIADPRFHSLIV